MVTTLNLPEEVHSRLKAVAAGEHRSVNATILVAVEEYLARRDHEEQVNELANQVKVKHAELLDRLAQ